jgi:hypothetical protein
MQRDEGGQEQDQRTEGRSHKGDRREGQQGAEAPEAATDAGKHPQDRAQEDRDGGKQQAPEPERGTTAAERGDKGGTEGDEVDDGSRTPPAEKPGGQPAEARDRAGRAGPGRDAAQFRPETATAADAVRQFETGAAEEGGDASSGKGPAGEGRGSAAMVLVEQWLQQAEGDPAYLLRNQFRLEEQRAVKQLGGLHEPRPW